MTLIYQKVLHVIKIFWLLPFNDSLYRKNTTFKLHLSFDIIFYDVTFLFFFFSFFKEYFEKSTFELHYFVIILVLTNIKMISD